MGSNPVSTRQLSLRQKLCSPEEACVSAVRFWMKREKPTELLRLSDCKSDAIRNIRLKLIEYTVVRKRPLKRKGVL